VVPSVQPMGNLFEQALFITFDAIVMTLRDRKGVTPQEMEARHRNLE
jgi:6-phospho-3-hexuloisomerase